MLQDQGNPPQSSDTVLRVNVIDADDQNPAFLNDQYKVTIPNGEKSVRNDYSYHQLQCLQRGTGINVFLIAGNNSEGGASCYQSCRPGHRHQLTGQILPTRKCSVISEP